ncbi:MAG TPA: 16S rRNA (adenine(1518)-N(6)/adenine(1519)-N(6))-dimethyltransferase RsmA [Alphaproteobacteria bacterium]|nr:16S rRNA (adenine(1518)-N(6)/adenine(1519)-N(6))-dimethyltransferase RsmA [Alphaproteobacteria bacterium]
MTDLSHLPPLRDVIRDHDLRAEKKLGQNFLLDLNLTDKIARAAGDLSGCTIFEIGPGPGGLTRSLLGSAAQKVIAVEYDPRAIKALEDLKEAAKGQLDILHADALETDLCSLAPPPRAIVANLPYNIATPLLVNWLRQIRNDHGNYRSMTLMFQKEVAQRITAALGDKAYGRLAVLAQWLCEVKLSFDVPASAFTPPPKVTSSIVHLRPRTLEGQEPAFETVENITAAAFGQRRKMIRSSLKNYIKYFDQIGLDETMRAENMSVQQFIDLAKLAEKD